MSCVVILMKYIIASLALVAGCVRSAPPTLSTHRQPSPVPRGWSKLIGPLADPILACPHHERCTVGERKAMSGAGDILAIATVDRFMDGALAVQTPAGWFVEPIASRAPWEGFSHHEPHSNGYDLAHTRIVGGELVTRNVDDQRVFYPGQGPVGTSSTTWSERTCRVIDGAVQCSPLTTIASQRCKTEEIPNSAGPAGSGGVLGGMPKLKHTCTGNEPAQAGSSARAGSSAAS
jgi:hypothetical protein